MTRRWKGWEFTAAAVAGVAAGFFMPTAFYGDGVAEIVTVLGFIMAALVPAMALAATAIRPGGFSVQRLRSLSLAVDRQIRVFGGLFLYAVAACIVLIGGKLVRWGMPSIPLTVVHLPSFDLAFVFPLTLTFLFVLLTLRSLAFVAGVLSILRLSAAVAEDEARARDSGSDRMAQEDLAAYEMPETFGTRIDRPH